MKTNKPVDGGTGLTNVLKSVVAAAFGVQSQANRERDFAKGRPVHFIIAGVLATLVFIFCLGLFVKIMIATSA